MRRRDFIGAAAGMVVAASWRAHGQPRATSRVGALHGGGADAESFVGELRGGLRELGYLEGVNLVLEVRSARGDLSRLPELVAELVRINVDVIVALYTQPALMAKQATRDIPIVVLSGDPLGTGLVTTLAKPGGNVTGVSLMNVELSGKCVELLRDMLPSVGRIAVMGNAADPVFAKPMIEEVKRAGRTLGTEIEPIAIVRGGDDLDAAFAAAARERAGAVIVQGSLWSKSLADLAVAHRLPAVAAGPRAFVEAGGLMSYGADPPSAFRRSAVFVDKILKGSNPADLPMEQPTKFELGINLVTARAIGLTIPDAFLQRADIVID